MSVSISALLYYADVLVSIPSSKKISEGDGIVQVCATLTALENTERNFTVTLTTSNDTGTQVAISHGKIII